MLIDSSSLFSLLLVWRTVVEPTDESSRGFFYHKNKNSSVLYSCWNARNNLHGSLHESMLDTILNTIQNTIWIQNTMFFCWRSKWIESYSLILFSWTYFNYFIFLYRIYEDIMWINLASFFLSHCRKKVKWQNFMVYFFFCKYHFIYLNSSFNLHFLARKNRRGALNRAPMMPRDGSLSDSFTPSL